MTEALLLTGAKGQLGSTIQQLWPHSGLFSRFRLHCCDIEDVDLTNATATGDYLDEVSPTVVVNGAAYTAVDRAEQDIESAYAVNEQAVRNLAAWCASHGSKLIQLSTDFVFAGDSSTPYKPDASTAPLSVYGASKRAGEQQLQRLLPESGVILRTSWLYSEFGNNFVKTMLRLMQEKPELGIVADQIGSPTSTDSLARAVFRLIETDAAGIYHWTDGAAISWYDFAAEIQTIGLEKGILQHAIPLKQLTTEQYPIPATRPAYSVLDISATLDLLGHESRLWQDELKDVIAKLAKNQTAAGRN